MHVPFCERVFKKHSFWGSKVSSYIIFITTLTPRCLIVLGPEHTSGKRQSVPHGSHNLNRWDNGWEKYIIFILRTGNWSSQRLNDLPKVIQGVCCKAWNAGVLRPSLVLTRPPLLAIYIHNNFKNIMLVCFPDFSPAEQHEDMSNVRNELSNMRICNS